MSDESDLAQEIRKAALDMALRHHSNATTPAAPKTVVVTAQAFEQFLLDGGMVDISALAAEQRKP